MTTEAAVWHLPITGLRTVFPMRACLNLPDDEPGTLVIGRVEPEHPGENDGGFVKPVQTPEEDAVAVEASTRISLSSLLVVLSSSMVSASIVQQVPGLLSVPTYPEGRCSDSITA